MDKELVAIWPANKKMVNFTWQVSDVCNYKCSYCNPGNYGAIHKNLDIEKYKLILDKIINNFLSKGYEHFKFFFSGGEPSYWPPLIEICKHIKSRVPNATLAINTNLSRPIEWWKENNVYFDDVVASFHIESCNQENYLKNVEYLQFKLNYLACRMLLHDKRFAEVVEFAELLKIKLKNCVIEYAALFEQLTPHSEMYHYFDEWKRRFINENSYFTKREVDFTYLRRGNQANCFEIYKDGSKAALNATRVIGEQKNNFLGWKCWINDSIFIGPAGDIQLASCSMAKRVGNINEDVDLLAKPVICAVKSCGCGTDINIRKLNTKFENLISGDIHE